MKAAMQLVLLALAYVASVGGQSGSEDGALNCCYPWKTRADLEWEYYYQYNNNNNGRRRMWNNDDDNSNDSNNNYYGIDIYANCECHCPAAGPDGKPSWASAIYPDDQDNTVNNDADADDGRRLAESWPNAAEGVAPSDALPAGGDEREIELPPRRRLDGDDNTTQMGVASVGGTRKPSHPLACYGGRNLQVEFEIQGLGACERDSRAYVERAFDMMLNIGVRQTWTCAYNYGNNYYNGNNNNNGRRLGDDDDVYYPLLVVGTIMDLNNEQYEYLESYMSTENLLTKLCAISTRENELINMGWENSGSGELYNWCYYVTIPTDTLSMMEVGYNGDAVVPSDTEPEESDDDDDFYSGGGGFVYEEPPAKGSITPGAGVGLAVGGLAIGAAITACALCFWMKKNRGGYNKVGAQAARSPEVGQNPTSDQPAAAGSGGYQHPSPEV